MLLIAQTLFPLCPFSKSKRGTKPHPDFLMYLKSILFVFSLGSSLGFWERDHPLLTIKYPQFPSTFVTSYSNTFVAIWETALWYSSSIWAWSLLHGLVMAFNLPPEAKRLVEWPTILCCMLSTWIIPAAIFFFFPLMHLHSLCRIYLVLITKEHQLPLVPGDTCSSNSDSFWKITALYWYIQMILKPYSVFQRWEVQIFISSHKLLATPASTTINLLT